VWNPWKAKAAALADLGDEEWQHFVCIEQANAARNAQTLEPGQSHLFRANYAPRSVVMSGGDQHRSPAESQPVG
jgi:D-hexose-6-phosphate mutarotase